MNPLYQQFGPKMTPSLPMNPFGGLAAAVQQARQIMGAVANPRQYALQALQQMGIQIPAEIQNDPDQITRYLLNMVPLSPEQKQLFGMK